MLVRDDSEGGKWTEFDAGSPRKDAALSSNDGNSDADEPSKPSGDTLF